MKKTDVLDWLKSNQDERGIAHWKKREDTSVPSISIPTAAAIRSMW
jgi:hypothetical protein